MLCVDKNSYDTSSENKAKNISDSSKRNFFPHIRGIDLWRKIKHVTSQQAKICVCLLASTVFMIRVDDAHGIMRQRRVGTAAAPEACHAKTQQAKPSFRLHVRTWNDSHTVTFFFYSYQRCGTKKKNLENIFSLFFHIKASTFKMKDKFNRL